MTEEDSPPIIEFKPTGAIVCPGLSFEKWQDEWIKLDRAQRSINWLVGDILIAGEQQHPEKWSQVLDPKFAEAQRGLMRVSLRIPLANRRDPDIISWSAHREAAAAETLEERLDLLDMAEANGWGSREIGAELRRRREIRRGNGGPPLDMVGNTADPTELTPSRSTWNNANTFGTPEEIGEPPVLVALEGRQDTPTVVSFPPPQVTPEAIREAIAAIRKVSNEIALGRAFPSAVAMAESLLYAVVRNAYALECLESYERALELLPDAWRGKITIEFGEEVFGGRTHTVTLTRPGGKQMALGMAPTLPCAIVDAILAARLSDMGAA